MRFLLPVVVIVGTLAGPVVASPNAAQPLLPSVSASLQAVQYYEPGWREREEWRRRRDFEFRRREEWRRRQEWRRVHGYPPEPPPPWFDRPPPPPYGGPPPPPPPPGFGPRY